MLNYKKPAFWVIAIAVAVCIVVAVCFLTNSKAAKDAVDESVPDEVTFEAEVLEIHDGYFLVAPEAGWALNSADRIEVPMRNIDPAPKPQVGDLIEITCSGEILETYPARLSKVYGIRAAKKASAVTKWFDYLETPDEMIWDGVKEINLDEFPDVTFRWHYEKLEAVTEQETVTLYTGMPIWSVFFCDLNGDGRPEICSSASFGSGMSDNRIVIYDYANSEFVEISDRGNYDYTLLIQDGKLHAEKRAYGKDELLASGELVWNDSYQIIWDFDNEADIGNPDAPSSVSFSSAVTYVGWHEDSGLYQRALNADTMTISSVCHLPIYKIESVTELERFKETFGSSVSFDQSYDEIPSFDDIAANYNDDFFTEHVLLLVYVEAGSGTYRYDAESISCDEKRCCVNVEQLNHPEAVTDDMAGWFIHVEMKKADIQKFVSFDAVLHG